MPILDIEDAYDQYGIPFYLKTDIEGADIVCLEALRNKKRRPAYVSMESDIDSYRQVAYEINLLESLGYDAFQVINQKDLAQIISPDSILEYGGSGDFGPWLPADGWRDRRHTLRTHRELSLWHKLFSRHGILRETPLQQPLTSIPVSYTHLDVYKRQVDSEHSNKVSQHTIHHQQNAVGTC